MAFQAKKLRVALPGYEGAGRPQPAALDLDAVVGKAEDCFSAVHMMVTATDPHWCWSHSCVDVWSDPVRPMLVSADRLPALREALEAQLREVEAAEQDFGRRLGNG